MTVKKSGSRKEFSMCEHCGGKVRAELVPSFVDKLFGLPGVELVNSVTVGTCESCGRHAYTEIPNLEGLIAAASLARIKIPVKLNAEEIKFLRKALGLRAQDLADVLEVRAETISRWENGKEVIGPTSEKLLRLATWIKLRESAPVIQFDDNEIADMKLKSVRSHTKPIRIRLQLVRIPRQKGKRGPAKATGWDEEGKEAAVGS